jgi:Kdo2-lipid IVA lauroyltransferase/acyltransferase
MAPPLPPPPISPRTWPEWFGIGLAWVAARLPWGLQRALGRAIGASLPLLLRRRGRMARRNLEVCFPELSRDARAALLRETYASLGIGLFEFARAWWGSVRPMQRTVRIEGLEHLAKARARGRGIIVISGHFLTLELCGRLLTGHQPLAGMYRPHEGAALEWAVKRGRLRYAAAMFTREELRPALRHLKSGGALWFAPDQETRRGDSVFVPFFGQPAWSLTSTHQLARLSGAAVLPFFHRRRDDGGYDLEVLPAFENFPSDDAEADTARVMAAIEALVRRAPGQYLWIHKRFKRRPEGLPSLYD